jgi:hypothetical protein
MRTLAKTDATNSPGLRAVSQVLKGQETSDGAGVRLVRHIGGPRLSMLDPFLLLDAFGSDDPDDYIAGFPEHPHRGFETVTYLHAGRVRHRDSAGHAGVIEAGGVQWMTAGRGIVHAEMPEQDHGRLAGFQLWVNLPAAHKMMAPRYQEIPGEGIPVERRAGGVEVRVIAGTTAQGTRGPVRDLITDVLYLDVSLPAGTSYAEPVPASHNAFLLVSEGEVDVDAGAARGVRRVAAGELALLGPGETVSVLAASPGEADSGTGRRDPAVPVRVVAPGARFLLVAGMPIGEPVARMGPFVMNTREELDQAYRDYQSGRLGRGGD